MRMDDPFYNIANAIFLEAYHDSHLDKKKTHVSRDQIGITVANLGEPLQNMFKIKTLRGGKLLTVTTFGLPGALALEHDLQGYQGMNTNGCAASMFSVGDAYRLIKDGYQHIMFTGGVDKNIGNFSHYILDTLAALNWYSNSEPQTACRPFDVERHGAV